MRFEEAFKYLRAGREIKLTKSTGVFFMGIIECKQKKYPVDLRIYYRSADGKVSRVKSFNARFLTTFDREVVDDN